MTKTELQRKIEDDLAWRGPNGKTLSYVVIPYASAALLLDPATPDAILAEIYRLTVLFDSMVPEENRARLTPKPKWIYIGE